MSCCRNRHRLNEMKIVSWKDMFILRACKDKQRKKKWCVCLPLEVTSDAKFSWSKSATIFFMSMSMLSFSYFFICSYTHATASSLLFFSQMPSQPINMKSMPFSSSNSYVSGLAVMACSSGLRCSRYLYFRSPKLRVRFKLPSTRPSVIVEPDFVILSISV